MRGKPAALDVCLRALLEPENDANETDRNAALRLLAEGLCKWLKA